jgi:hypothetical protein
MRTKRSTRTIHNKEHPEETIQNRRWRQNSGSGGVSNGTVETGSGANRRRCPTRKRSNQSDNASNAAQKMNQDPQPSYIQHRTHR